MLDGKLVCLGIESTAHTFGIGIVTEDGKILANERDMYRPALGKGIIPHEAAAHHQAVGEKILNRALEKSGLGWDGIDILSYSAGPGLPPCLNKGADFAINLSKLHKKSLIPVNHSVAHLEIGRLMTNTKDPVYLYLSGGNTMVVAYAENFFRVFGETEDVPVGNCFDVVAREMKLPMPGGPEIERLAIKGKYIELPYVVKGMDTSFSGIQTAAIKLLKKGAVREDVAFSLQETCFAMLTEVVERALAHTEKKEVLLVGGVAANKRLQEMVGVMAEERGAKVHIVPTEYSGDQGAMIAWTGMLAHRSGWKPDFTEKITPKWRVDEVRSIWF